MNVARPMQRFSLVLTALVGGIAQAQSVRHVGAGGFATIQAAIDAARPGDVVLVDAGVYPSFHVGKPLVVTAAPSALVQVVSTDGLSIDLGADDRVHLAGLDVQVAGITVQGGLVSLERCTLRTDHGMKVNQAVVTFRWSSAGAMFGSGVLAVDSELHASDSTFSTAAPGTLTIEHGGVKLLGASNCQMALCTLVGAWPTNVAMPWPSVGLHISRAHPSSRTWLVDCTLRGGFHATGPQGPSMVTNQVGQARVRLHRTQVSGYAIGNIDTGPVLGLHTPVDMAIGSTFVTTMRGEPGHALILYIGSNVTGPMPLPLLEQVALGFHDLVFLPTVIANASGTADVPFTTPNNPALRHSILFWRGLDVSVYPFLAPPLFVTVMQ